MIDKITVGDTLDFSTDVINYPPSAGWTLKFRLVPKVTGTAIDITSAPSNDQHRVQVGPTVTATWAAGDYSWTSWVEKAGARYVTESGLVTLLPNPASSNVYADPRSFAVKLLEQIEAALASRGNKAQLKYSIGDRSVEYSTFEELLKARSRLQREVAGEENAARLAAGLPSKNRILVRF
jgi:hypothetical protein